MVGCAQGRLTCPLAIRWAALNTVLSSVCQNEGGLVLFPNTLCQYFPTWLISPLCRAVAHTIKIYSHQIYLCERGPCIFYPSHLTHCCRVLAPLCPQRMQGILRDPRIQYTCLVESELSVSDSPRTSSHLGNRGAEEQNGCSRKYQYVELVFLLSNFPPLVKAQERPGP